MTIDAGEHVHVLSCLGKQIQDVATWIHTYDQAYPTDERYPNRRVLDLLIADLVSLIRDTLKLPLIESVSVQLPERIFDAGGETLTRCQGQTEGDQPCHHVYCPQRIDHEPELSGRSCPFDEPPHRIAN